MLIHPIANGSALTSWKELRALMKALACLLYRLLLLMLKHTYHVIFAESTRMKSGALFNQDTDGRWGIEDEKGEQMNKQFVLSSSLPNTMAPSQPPIPKVKKYKTRKASTTIV